MASQQVRATIVIFLSYWAAVGSMTSTIAFFPTVAAVDKGQTVTMIGTIFGAVGFSNLVFSTVFGKLLEITSARFLILSGLFTVSGSMLIQSLLIYVQSGLPFFLTAMCSNIVKGLGFLAVGNGVMAIISTEFESRTALYLGLYELASGIASATCPVMGSLLYDATSFDITFITAGAVGFLVLLLVFFISRIPTTHGRITKKDNERFEDIKTMLKMPAYYLIILSVVLSVSISVSFEITINIYTSQQFQLTPSQGSTYLFVYHGVYGLLSPFIGYLTDKRKGHKTVLFLGHSVACLGLIFLGPAEFTHIEPQKWLTLIASGVTSLGATMCFVPAIGLFNELLRYNGIEGLKNFISTTMIFGISLGSCLGPIVAGAIVDRTGFRSLGLFIGITSAIIGLLNFFSFMYLKHKASKNVVFEQRNDERRQLLPTH